VAIEGTSSAAGVAIALRSLAPGGICKPVGYYLPPGTKVPLMHMYANDATLKIAVSSVRPVLPDLLDFVARTDFPAELVTTLSADWDDTPSVYGATPRSLCCGAHPCTPSAQREEFLLIGDRFAGSSPGVAAAG
jgi:threonine dehydrogenase-like Zn-dependent dehydrogenase